MRFFIYVLLTLYLIPIKSFSYEEINCTSIQNEIDIKHTYYIPDACYKFSNGGVNVHAVDFFDGNVYLFFEIQKIIASNSRWANDWAYQSIKKENIENLIGNFGLGNNPSIDSKSNSIKSSNNRIRYEYRNFETSEGKGVYGGNTINQIFYTFGFFTYDKSSNLNESFLREILSSLKIPGVNNGLQSSLKLTGISNSNSTIQELSNALDESDTVESYTGQRTFMLNWENVGLMQGTLSFDEQERTGRIDFKLPNDNSTCFGTYALSQANGTWSFLCSNDSSATGSLQWNSSDNSVVGNGKDNQNNSVQFMVAGQ